MSARLKRFIHASALRPAFLAAVCLFPLVVYAQTASRATPIPKIVEKDGRYALMVDGAPYLMLGAQVNNSSAWPAELPKVWPTMDFLHVNTVEAPIYWEQFEAERGHFDPSILHTLIDQARAHHVHLVLLWFGTWKNASGHYTPLFIKLNEAEVPHVTNDKGGKVDSLAPYSKLALEADSKAFAHLLRELKTYDPQHTVLMVQVENESGTYGTDRDHSPEANRLFAEDVPATVLKAMGTTKTGGWEHVFGEDAAEYFQAYSVSRYINQVAAAGKAENPLPMYVNVALRDPFHPGHAGGYASGGPTDNVVPIWKATAPAIDAIGPDIYMPEYDKYEKVLDLYHRPDNAMFVPETGNSTGYARYFFTALGHQAIGFSPFGMDKTGYLNAPLGADRMDDEAIAPFALNYRIFGPMDRVIAKLNFEGKVQGVSEDPAMHVQTLAFGTWRVVVSYGLPQFGGWGRNAPGNTPASGGAMVAQLGPNEFLVTAVHARVEFEPTEKGRQRQFVAVQEGHYDGNVWKMSRVWNGDQSDYGLNFTAGEQVLRVTLATY